MQTIYIPKYNLHYRVNPKDPKELQWSRKVYGPATQWQHAITFKKPIRALDRDDKTGQGVVVLNDSSTYVGSGMRCFGRKFYPAGTRIYSLYAIGESNMKSKLKINVREARNANTADLFRRLAETVSKIMKSGKVNIYYDSVPDYPANIYVGSEGYEIALYRNGDMDPNIDEWLKDFESESVDSLAENTYIALGNPYRRADDDEAGKTIPTFKEWDTTLKVFSPNYYDPTIDIYCREFNGVSDIERFIQEHSNF